MISTINHCTVLYLLYFVCCFVDIILSLVLNVLRYLFSKVCSLFRREILVCDVPDIVNQARSQQFWTYFAKKKSTFAQKACKRVHFLPKSTQKSPLSSKKAHLKVHFFPKSTLKSPLFSQRHA